MAKMTQNTELLQDALAYVAEIYRELSHENGSPSLGTQNQAVHFILADPALSDAVVGWAAHTHEATTAPRHRMPHDDLYVQVRAFLERTMERPVLPRGRT